MNTEELKLLLAKYEQVESSLEEELRLREMLASPDLPKAFEPYRRLFTLYDAAKEQELNRAFSEKDFGQRPAQKRVWMLRVAAALVFILISYAGIQYFNADSTSMPDLYADTFDNPEVAMQEAQKLLTMVSERINKGQEAFIELDKLNQTSQRILKP
jgi:hypothetical protein